MYLICRTIELSAYWTVGLSGCQITGLSPLTDAVVKGRFVNKVTDVYYLDRIFI